jgi:hypothetical protein
VSVPKTIQDDDEEFFMIRSRSVHLRLLPSLCKPRGPGFPLLDFEHLGFYTDLEQASLEDEREERKDTNMGDTLMLAIYFPLVIVGMVLVIMWGMSAAGPRRNGYAQDESERLHSHEV